MHGHSLLSSPKYLQLAETDMKRGGSENDIAVVADMTDDDDIDRSRKGSGVDTGI